MAFPLKQAKNNPGQMSKFDFHYLIEIIYPSMETLYKILF